MTWDVNLASDHAAGFMKEVAAIATELSKMPASINNVCAELNECRARGGRVFVVGVGGSAGNASHMVNDLRKLCGIEAYAPTDNVSELTARINDDGFDEAFVSWLVVSKFSAKDVLFVLSVGGGNKEFGISSCISNAVEYAWRLGAPILGVVGRHDGDAVKYGDGKVIVVPPINPSRVTPYSESFQAVVWHCIVSSPALQRTDTKW